MFDKWFDILKESGWKTGSIAASAAAFLIVIWLGWLPYPENSAWIYGAVLLLALSTFLTLASILKGILDRTRPFEALARNRQLKAERDRIIDELDHLDDLERDVIGYMLSKQQRMVTLDIDGGHLVTLISKGIFQRALRPGQHFDMLSVPFAIPPHVWAVLKEESHRFPSQPHKAFRESDPPPYRGGLWARDRNGKLPPQA